MEVKIIKSVSDDFDKLNGPSTTTMVFLSIDGFLFHLGNFYEGRHDLEGTGERLKKIEDFELWLNNALIVD